MKVNKFKRGLIKQFASMKRFGIQYTDKRSQSPSLAERLKEGRTDLWFSNSSNMETVVAVYIKIAIIILC